MMTERAQELGMSQTTFMNATGLLIPTTKRPHAIWPRWPGS